MSKLSAKDFLKQIRSFPPAFWILNLMQMAERLAFWIALIQLPIFIAQKDAPGGLHWEQATKGIIFFWWALVQNITPVFTGAFADRYGYKKVLAISFSIIISGYLLLSFQREFFPFLAATLVLGFGSGIFKPALQGSIARTLNKENSSTGWGIYVMLLNLAVFLGPPIAIFLKDISWTAVFIGCAVIFALNFIFIFLYRDFPVTESVEIKIRQTFKNIFSRLLKPKIAVFLLLMSGFTIIYMQFYETLPNFIYDWTDSTKLVDIFNLPEFMTAETSRGGMINYEWFYNLNSGLIIIGVVFLSWALSRMRKTVAIFLGMVIASAGLMLSGISMSGMILVVGILTYTTGEMITNPRFNDYMSSIAPENEKALHMSLLNISWAIGLGGGSLLGGWLYGAIGEKAALAKQYLMDNNLMQSIPEGSKAFSLLLEKTGMSASEATSVLWNSYDPWLVWLPFFAVGMISAAGIFIYSKKIDQ